jgi:hypothetical protein
MKISFGKACDAEERLNNMSFSDNPANILKDLLVIYAFNSNLELADDLDEQLNKYSEYLNSLVLWNKDNLSQQLNN